jgi:hypothetical protein
MPPKSSSIHAHYQEEVINKSGKTVSQRRCRHCNDVFSINSSTDTLNKHYNREHKDLPPPPRIPRPSSSSCVDQPANKRLRVTQSTLDNSILRIHNDDLAPALASLWAHCSWAHRIVELPQFLDVAAALRSSDCRLPSRDQLRTAQLRLAESLRTRVVRQLSSCLSHSPSSSGHPAQLISSSSVSLRHSSCLPLREH